MELAAKLEELKPYLVVLGRASKLIDVSTRLSAKLSAQQLVICLYVYGPRLYSIASSQAEVLEDEVSPTVVWLNMMTWVYRQSGALRILS